MHVSKPAIARSINLPAGEAREVGRVLLIDDTASRRSSIAAALLSDGFEVIESAGGIAAIEAAALRSPEAIVLDLAVWTERSLEVCKRLKATSATLLPVLCLSSRTSREARARALDAGFDAYLLHPFDPNELCAAVGALIRLRRQEAMRIASVLNELHDQALDTLTESIAFLDADGEIIAVNRPWIEFATANGYEGDGGGVGTNYVKICDAASGSGSNDAHQVARGLRNIASGKNTSFDFVYPCHSPTHQRWYQLSARPLRGAGPATMIVTHRDSTREEHAIRAEREALAEADADRRRLGATLEALPVGVWISDATGRLTHSNPAAARVWGGDAPLSQSVEGYAIYQAWWGDTGIPVAAEEWTLVRAMRTGQALTDFMEILRFDGARGHILISAAPILDAGGAIAGGVAVAMDITERQEESRERERLVESLERERSRLATIFEQAPAFLAVLRGTDYVFERINPAYLALVGQRDPVGKPMLEAIPELRGQGFVELLDAVRTTGVPFVGKHLPVQLTRTPGGPTETRYADLVYLRLDDGDAEYSIVAHGVDVTDQVIATESLERIEQRLRDQFAKLPVPTYLWEVSGDDFVLLDCNEEASRSFPAFASSSIGAMSRDAFPDKDVVRADLRRCLAENVVVRRVVEFDGGEQFGKRMLDMSFGPQQPDRVLVHAVDTTNRVELEAQLRQAQKMDAVGRLAGGVAHDFNNLLTVIGAHSSFLLETLDSADPRHEDANVIHKAGIRAAGLTRQLLAFSRKQILKPSILNLNAIVSETRQMLARLLGEDVEIVTVLAADLGSVVGDASQIDQVIVNLAVNARDAMPAGGSLTITTRNVTVTSNLPGASHRTPAGDYVLLEVSDTGIGMTPAVQARLFEPFFTTKEPGKGTGLGLATVYGIVKQSAGYIHAQSVVNEGTTFQIFLPVVIAAVASDQLRVAESSSVRGVETILLIEDESSVRDIATRILKRQGYVVLIAANGAEALEISASFASPIHLVISDSVMPGMTGAEVVRRLQEQRPGLKALFMSGYTDDEILRRGIVSSAAAFIQKPFTLADFARAAREALDG